MYIKIVYSNGFCGCDEEHFLEVDDVEDAEAQFASDIEHYGFFWPDNRFIDDECSDEEYEEELESYQQDIYANSYWEEITKEEYEENT